MKTVFAVTGVALAVFFWMVSFTGCSQSPLETNHLTSSSSVSPSGAQSSGTETVQFALEPGGKYIITTSDFGKSGLAAFTSVSLEISDPRVPIYQPDHCDEVDIVIDGYDDFTNTGCNASSFRAESIAIVSRSEMTLEVKADLGTLSVVKDPTEK